MHRAKFVPNFRDLPSRTALDNTVIDIDILSLLRTYRYCAVIELTGSEAINRDLKLLKVQFSTELWIRRDQIVKRLLQACRV